MTATDAVSAAMEAKVGEIITATRLPSHTEQVAPNASAPTALQPLSSFEADDIYVHPKVDTCDALLPSTNKQEGTLTFQLESLIGFGTFAAVFLASDVSCPGTKYAVKVLVKMGLTNRQLAVQRREIDIHNSAMAPSSVTLTEGRTADDLIIPLLATHETATYIYLVLPYCPSDLYDLIQSHSIHQRLTDEFTNKVMQDLILAIRHCHSHGIYHRDIKPENVLIDSHGDVKLADFGLATMTKWESDVGCGTKGYLPPEALTCEYAEVNKEMFAEDSGWEDEEVEDVFDAALADVWALGMTMINLRFGCKLWETAEGEVVAPAYLAGKRNVQFQDPFYAKFHSNPRKYFETMFPFFSEQLVDILMKIFAVNLEGRITIDELWEMFKDGNIKFSRDQGTTDGVEEAQYVTKELEQDSTFESVSLSRACSCASLESTGTAVSSEWAGLTVNSNVDSVPFELFSSDSESEATPRLELELEADNALSPFPASDILRKRSITDEFIASPSLFSPIPVTSCVFGSVKGELSPKTPRSCTTDEAYSSEDERGFVHPYISQYATMMNKENQKRVNVPDPAYGCSPKSGFDKRRTCWLQGTMIA